MDYIIIFYYFTSRNLICLGFYNLLRDINPDLPSLEEKSYTDKYHMRSKWLAIYSTFVVDLFTSYVEFIINDIFVNELNIKITIGR